MLKTTTPLRPASALAARAGFAALFLLMLLACVWPAPASAQSGRRRPAPISPAPTPTPTPTPQEAQGESESVPRGSSSSATKSTVASFLVFENDDAFLAIDRMTRQDITDAFVRRMSQAAGVSASSSGRATRQEARDRARSEREAFIVLFQIEEDSFAAGSSSRSDPRTFVIRTYVFAPQTGDLKFQDTVHQRPYRESATIGGIRVPVPNRRIERYPSELQLQQAARDAADRLLRRFNITLPPER
jgi:hypothetical protein